MKKSIIAVLMGIILVSMFTGCSQKEAVSQTKLDAIKESGKLVMGTSAAYPPYEFHSVIDGVDQVVGFDIDIAKAIAEDLGVELEIKDMNFDAVLTGVSTGMVDIGVAGITPTDERKKSSDFSKVYYQAKQAIIIAKDNESQITTAADLTGKTIGVQIGTTQEQMAMAIDGATVKSLAKASDLILELKSHKIDAVMMEIPVAKSYASQNPDLMVPETVEFENTDSGSAVIMAKGETDLVDAINQTIDKLISEGKIDQFVADATMLSNQAQN